ncbi:MAG: bifunctional (p)ppGpp synthetase/guanosine-3',5'-bis(diphosphate) 3'-pyrophosphohydrolase [Rickettsiaceae bacterium]|jgi:(p)ppGpp synthase/HD superfamily hydrolase|nr:bifunctional (p)ppGpp synthetase/guanosine-3',5'-bis(diphosphate) 3'-pyrophosphohydrolase [Rickettsiaceae bacterium]BBB57718.1 guanosine polyphosphate pyrophosphohydrolase [Candidatus Megaera polyxenophila]BBB57831.1 guanosine polyphosphate pyrophosphohydrolase [Candidatus Megaera polyxenophila]BBB57917.1 guanosine polyphosphate pyrophosphohydrolase [Candidatus Megaera polyxenophila]
MDYSEPCKYSIRLIEKLKSLDTKNILDFGLINKAIYWAKKYHGDQKRKSGEPYYSHPLEVAYMISEHKLKTDVIVASILHDIIEDTEVTVGMIFDNFSWRIAQMVDMLTRDRPDGTKLTIEEVITNAYKKADKEVLLIKLIDRLHNIQTIESMSTQKIEKIIAETLTNFIASSMYLGLLEIEQQLTESCMYYDSKQKNKPYKKKSIFSFNDHTSPLLSLIS